MSHLQGGEFASKVAIRGFLIVWIQSLQHTPYFRERARGLDFQVQFSVSSGILKRNCGSEAMRGRFVSSSPNESFLDIAGGAEFFVGAI